MDEVAPLTGTFEIDGLRFVSTFENLFLNLKINYMSNFLKYSINSTNVVTLVVVLLFFTETGFAQMLGLSDPDKVLKPLYGEIAPILSYQDLTKVVIPNTVIESAVVDPNGYVVVTAVVNHPPANDRVKVWIGLPLKGWNGRFCGVGGGGFMGGSSSSLDYLTDRGCAVGSTNGGHDGPRAFFALDTLSHSQNWQEIRDFAYLGIHDMTVVGKALVKAFYGKPASYSYFIGGSNGGRQGITNLQRYPEDYNGVVAYYPAIYFTRNLFSALWPQAVMNDARNLVSRAKLKAVNKAMIAACDGDDGVVDGVINDPLHCTWDPKIFVGTAVGESTFTEADADVVRKIWEGPRTHDGKFLWYGMTRGADLLALAGTSGDPLKGLVNPTFLDWIRYFLVNDPHWDISSLTCTEFELLWQQSIEQYGQIFYAENPDLTPFRNQGGKLLLVHGLADQLIVPQTSINYLEQVQSRMGGAKATSKFMRLFLAPGIDHYVLGPGPVPSGIFDAVVSWVEEGKAPERITAIKQKSGKIIRTRPLFPYPHVARYSGSGSTDDAANFEKK